MIETETPMLGRERARRRRGYVAPVEGAEEPAAPVATTRALTRTQRRKLIRQLTAQQRRARRQG